MVKSTDCSSKGPGVNSQHPYGSSQLSVTPVSGYLMPSHRQIYRQNTNVYKINKYFFLKSGLSSNIYAFIVSVGWENQETALTGVLVQSVSGCSLDAVRGCSHLEASMMAHCQGSY